MELTLDQALQKGIEAHKAGKAQEADRYYTGILKANPKHPDANHNMGVLAVGVGKVLEALPFFKTALEVNPNIAQFWLSYIDALIKLDRMDEARAAFDQAKSHGVQGDSLDKIEKRLGLENPKGINVPKKSQEPPEDQLQGLVNLYTQNHFEKALNAAVQLLEQFPYSSILYNIIGAINKSLGKLEEAIKAYTKALSINPDYAEAHNNMGNAFKDQRKLEEAIEAYTKALSVKPNYVEAYNNMGNALKDQGKLEEAIAAFGKALSIKPDFGEAHYNMGNVFKDQGKLDDAIEAYTKALSINPDYAEAYNNMGNVLQDQGKLEEAIEAFNKAIILKPDFDKVWYNIGFPLQAIKISLPSNKKLISYYPKNISSKNSLIAKSILHYTLNRGQKSEETALKQALIQLGKAENKIIQNPTKKMISNISSVVGPSKIVALVHFGRSGTGLLHSLVDNHPQVSTLPSIYLSEYFNYSTWDKITEGGWNKLVDKFMSIYDVLFDASSVSPLISKGGRLLHKIGVKEGMANVGRQRNEVLRVDRTVFNKRLNQLINFHDKMDIFTFFRLVHEAYNSVTNDLKDKSLIFYHIHNPDTHAQLNFARLNPNTNWLILVREPIQSCESWVRQHFIENDYFGVASRILTMLYEIDNIIYKTQQSIGVRLEDLKRQPKETIPALCNWMGIEENECLYEMTAQGKKWWGDPTSLDYSKDGMEPFGKTSIDRAVGSIFSKNDQFILCTLFYPFRVRFGYTAENGEKFKADLKKIRPMIDEMFDFEKKIAEKMKMSFERFMNSGSYIYLRVGLINRWTTLNEFHTYPNMIKPLKI